MQEDPITKAEREFYKIIKEVSLKFKVFAIQKRRAVLYRALVTILRLASMQYITKPATAQSQKTRWESE